MDSEREPRSCPLCDGSESIPVLTKGSLQLVQCSRCSMIFSTPVEAELASGKFYDRLGTPFYLSPDKLASDYASVRFERELRWFRRYCPGGRVLDVGCSTGAFLHQLRTRFPGEYDVTGTDVASAALEHASLQGIRTISDSFIDAHFPEGPYDAITFWAVMEHLVHPKLFLERAAGRLASGGVCLILVPNWKSLAVRLLGSKYRYIMPDHVNYFTASTLLQFASTQPALSVVALGSSHFNPMVLLKDCRSSAARVSDRERAQLLKRTTGWKQNPLLEPARWIYSAMERLLVAGKLADNLVLVLRKR